MTKTKIMTCCKCGMTSKNVGPASQFNGPGVPNTWIYACNDTENCERRQEQRKWVSLADEWTRRSLEELGY